MELRLSNRFSVGVEALHRDVGRDTRAEYSPPFDLGGGVIITSQTSTGTDYAWEFPVLAKYRLRLFGKDLSVESGPSFRPAENNEQYGIAAGLGMEMRLRSLRIEPVLRYTRWMDKDFGPDPMAHFTRPRPDQLALVVGISQATTAAWASAFGQDITVGAVVGIGLTNAFRTHAYDLQGAPSFTKFSESTKPIVGLALEFEPMENLFLEVNGLYRPLHVTGASTSIGGEQLQTNGEFSVLTWEFPVLAKYKWAGRRLNPFIELGPSFRATGNLNGYDPSHFGVTGGVGAEIDLGKLKVAPAIRYNRWQADSKQPGTIQNQAELIVRFFF